MMFTSASSSGPWTDCRSSSRSSPGCWGRTQAGRPARWWGSWGGHQGSRPGSGCWLAPPQSRGRGRSRLSTPRAAGLTWNIKIFSSKYFQNISWPGTDHLSPGPAEAQLDCGSRGLGGARVAELLETTTVETGERKYFRWKYFEDLSDVKSQDTKPGP